MVGKKTNGFAFGPNLADLSHLNYEVDRLVCSLRLQTPGPERSWRVISHHAGLQTSPKGKLLQP